ncbi:hypothetical protein GQ43DRAFT_299253 [Delitschia confertaspora ATCC 74209]|uniref:Uncharacterized protein n=1 Tax=Delitschia confertaspora ATCC 74209 TaxID=1513339 RepID=A0A9P4JUI5_9PLEO|nr:hypothetical protein GQ43DRAFT_299253 [Delitschia confertaspora ATCC 74209]
MSSDIEKPAATATESEISASKLEAQMVTTNVPRPPMSRDVIHVKRHTKASGFASPQELFTTIEYHDHLSRTTNFLFKTNVECLNIEGKNSEWLELNEQSLRTVLHEVNVRSTLTPVSPNILSSPLLFRRFLIL